jgi:hypothetical protein
MSRFSVAVVDRVIKVIAHEQCDLRTCLYAIALVRWHSAFSESLGILLDVRLIGFLPRIDEVEVLCHALAELSPSTGKCRRIGFLVERGDQQSIATSISQLLNVERVRSRVSTDERNVLRWLNEEPPGSRNSTVAASLASEIQKAP